MIFEKLANILQFSDLFCQILRKQNENSVSDETEWIIGSSPTRGLVHCAISGQPERSVYGSKRIKSGYFMLTRYFLYTEIHLRPSSEWIADRFTGPFTEYHIRLRNKHRLRTVLIKFLFNNSVHCSKYFFFFNIDFIYSNDSIIYLQRFWWFI
jgi:hypothetical protein